MMVPSDDAPAVSSTGLFGVSILLRDKRKPKRTQMKETFTKRQQARQWCRNHWYKFSHVGMEIIHPDGTREPFKWDGIL